MTLHELAAEYGVSAERIRQIEVAAMKKMRKALAKQRPERCGLAQDERLLAGAVFRPGELLARQLRLGEQLRCRRPAPSRRCRSARTAAPGPGVSNTKEPAVWSIGVAARRLAGHLGEEDLELLGRRVRLLGRAAQRDEARIEAAPRSAFSTAGVSRSGSTVTNTPCTRSPSAPSARLTSASSAIVVGQTSGHCV